jgi:adenosine deaminase
VASIWQALHLCGAHRLVHATRLTDDMTVIDGKIVKLGTLAQSILDRRIPLEMCLSSKVHTGAVRSMSEHPFRLYFERGFRVTINTDDRLMSDTSMTKEFGVAVEEFDLGVQDLEKITVNAMKSAFAHFDERLSLIYGKIKPGYAALKY